LEESLKSQNSLEAYDDEQKINGISLPLRLNNTWTRERLSITSFVENPGQDMVVSVTWFEGYCEVATWCRDGHVYTLTGTTLGVSKVKPRVKE